MKNLVFTINAEYNSNGKEIAKKLSKELNIPYYENEIIKMASKKFNIPENIFYSIEEWNLNYLALPFPLDFGMSFTFPNFLDDFVPLQDKVFNAKNDIIKNISKESCIILCKCSNYMLKNKKNCINVLIYSNDLDRIKIEKNNNNNLSERKLKKLISKKDKKMANYYSYYTTNNWDNKKTYDILINSSKLGINGSVNILKNIFINFINNVEL